MRHEKITKKPITVEAVQWDGTAACATEVIDWVLNQGGTANFYCSVTDGTAICYGDRDAHTIKVHTFEGVHDITPGSWVIRGVQGEFYGIKDDILHETYTIDSEVEYETNERAFLAEPEAMFQVEDLPRSFVKDPNQLLFDNLSEKAKETWDRETRAVYEAASEDFKQPDDDMHTSLRTSISSWLSQAMRGDANTRPDDGDFKALRGWIDSGAVGEPPYPMEKDGHLQEFPDLREKIDLAVGRELFRAEKHLDNVRVLGIDFSPLREAIVISVLTELGFHDKPVIIDWTDMSRRPVIEATCPSCGTRGLQGAGWWRVTSGGFLTAYAGCEGYGYDDDGQKHACGRVWTIEMNVND